MDEKFYLDIKYLRAHVPEIQDERRTAQRLRDSVRMTRDLGDPNLAPRYSSIIHSVDNLVLYFDKMADVFEDLAYEGNKLSKKISQMVDEGSEQVRIENDKIML